MPPLRSWPVPARALYWLGLLLGPVCLAAAWAGAAASPLRLAPGVIAGALVFFLASAVADLFPISLGSFEFSISSVPRVAAMLLFPQPIPSLVASLSSAVADVIQGKSWTRVAWNASTGATNVLIGTTVYHLISGRSDFTSGEWIQVPAILVMALAYYASNLLSITLLLALIRRERVLGLIQANLNVVYMDIPGTILFGVLVAFTWHDRPYLAVIAGGLAVVVHNAFAYADRLRRETVEALETVADIVDARDPYTYNHSLLVAELSRMMAGRLGVGAADTETIVLAAYLHDIGKIGIPDRLLHKDAQLTDEEFEKLKEHPALGARILERYSQFRAGSDIVLSHQEKYDGTGYPRGLRGDGIPMGARIIAVVDSYVAMTTDRPYRRALPAAEACSRLTEGIGSQFDPVVCGTFIKMLAETELDQVDNVVEMQQLRERRLASR